jgi:hypothetical protein
MDMATTGIRALSAGNLSSQRRNARGIVVYHYRWPEIAGLGFYRRLPMIWSGVIAAIVLLASLGASSRTVDTFWLKVSAQVIAENGSLQLTCHVPRHANNRSVELGIEGYTSSTFQLDGEDSRVTHQILFKRVPCHIGAAYCVVTDNGNYKTGTKLTVLVSGCDQP